MWLRSMIDRVTLHCTFQLSRTALSFVSAFANSYLWVRRILIILRSKARYQTLILIRNMSQQIPQKFWLRKVKIFSRMQFKNKIMIKILRILSKKHSQWNKELIPTILFKRRQRSINLESKSWRTGLILLQRVRKDLLPYISHLFMET